MTRTISNFCLAALLTAGMTRALPAAEPFQDPSLPIEKRVENLVSLLTLEEKVAMLGQVQPAIPRLNIKAFTNFTEGLHGIGWARGGSLTATQFPQSVGLGETWDPEILRQVGAVEGYEARVYFQKFSGSRVGLAVRTPNVDLTRDPRWGRAEESFGEDPFAGTGLRLKRGEQKTIKAVCRVCRPRMKMSGTRRMENNRPRTEIPSKIRGSKRRPRE